MPQDALDAQIIDSMEKLWERVLAIREFSSRFTFFQSILLEEEYGDVVSGKIKGIVPVISQEEFDKQVHNLTADIEIVRPFVGETIWLLYYIYAAFSMRQAFKVQEGLKNGELYTWDKGPGEKPDSFKQQVLGVVFTEQELSQLDAHTAIPWITRSLETKILNEMNEWIFNRHFHKPEPDKQQSIQNSIIVSGNLDIGGDLTGRDKIVAN
jgi:hypothetical protein